MSNNPRLKKQIKAFHTYTYDSRNRLTAIDNKRVSKTVNGVKTYFIYDGHKLIGEYKLNLSDNSRQEYVYLNSTPIATMTANETRRVYADHLDTSRRVATNNEEAKILWKWESKSFGESKATGDINFNLRFPGQYFDSETATHYNINRDYNPVTGRYIQRDPIGFDGGVNGFGYVGGRPITHSDLMGLWASKSGFYVHQDANQRILEKYIGLNGVGILNYATDVVDAAHNQEGWMSHKHAMRGIWYGGGLRSVSSARQESNFWVRQQYQTAWEFEDAGNIDMALYHFGKALHTLQDETSPAHEGWQIWDGTENWIDLGVHGSQELFEWQTIGTRLDSVTDMAYSWFYWRNLPSGNLFGS